MKSRNNFATLVASCERAYVINDAGKLRDAIGALECRFPASSEMPLAHLCTLAGLLIDVGGILGLPEMVQRGLSIFEENWGRLEPVYGSAQLHYNLGNAYKALYDIVRKAPEWKFNPATSTSIFEAKAAYWKALSAATLEKAKPEQLTNLANALDASGRVIDALHYYDYTLKKYPKFGMALLNRGLSLMYLSRVSASYSIKLMHEIYMCFDSASLSDSLDPHLRERARQHAKAAVSIIREHGYEPDEDSHSVQETDAEARQHDSYWHWCLDHSLALCEHSLYCRCTGARRDDLSILTPGASLTGPKVPMMELTLNRMKSEFCLSRALLFQSMAHDPSQKWNLTPFEGTFTELLNREEIGLETEFMRTSFRLCFGILDRIARGVCMFFNVAEDDEKLYFDSFWRPRGTGNSRWETLNSLSNPNIVALYGLAKDLNERGGGEWSRLKRYRNLFEHEFCLVCSDSVANEAHEPVPWLDGESIPSIYRSELSADVLDMLRFTRAAIFYFAFLIRMESRDPNSERTGVPITFGKKPIGKD